MKMHRLRNLDRKFSVPIPADEQGFVGRECPQRQCEGYFKVKPGTGLENVPCHCPYCGHAGENNTFFTNEQIEYLRSVVMNKVTGALLGDLKDMASSFRGGFVTAKVTGSPHPIRYYRESRLETELTCGSCSLQYAIYGLFAFCPDCGAHNSLQILENNLEFARKELALSESVEASLAQHLIGDALENAVSAFDGFGRQLCTLHRARSTHAEQASALSFQNLPGARTNVLRLFLFDLSSSLSPDDWALACRAFQKRHLLAHKMGIIDEAYIAATRDPAAIVGRKVTIAREEVIELIALVRKIAEAAERALSALPPEK